MYRNNYLIAYDITCNKRRNRVFKRLSECAFPMQNSVFLLHVSSIMITQIWNEIRELSDLDEDNIFCVTLNRQGFCQSHRMQNTCISLHHDCPQITKLLN
jgi:CRISPR-associated endonuclease Cas2